MSFVVKFLEDAQDVMDSVQFVNDHVNAEYSTYQDYEVDPDKVVALGYKALQSPQTHCCVVLRVDGKLQGFLYATALDLPFAKDAKVAYDLIVFISKGHRSYGNLKRLTDKYVEWAKSIGAKEARLGTLSGYQTELVSKCYSVLGFEYLGALHRKELKNG